MGSIFQKWTHITFTHIFEFSKMDPYSRYPYFNFQELTQYSLFKSKKWTHIALTHIYLFPKFDPYFLTHIYYGFKMDKPIFLIWVKKVQIWAKKTYAPIPTSPHQTPPQISTYYFWYFFSWKCEKSCKKIRLESCDFDTNTVNK